MTGRQTAVIRLALAGAASAWLIAPAFGAEAGAWTRAGCTVDSGGVHASAGRAVLDSALANSRVLTSVSSGLAADGAAYVHARAGDLELTKTVWRSGEFTIRLERGDDTVLIRVGRGDLTVTRGGESTTLAPDSAGEDQFLAARMLLAGSRSVRALRLVGAGLAAGAERSPGGLALILADAMVGLLDGDVTAVQRVAERLGRKRAAVRLASAEEGCYERWEGEVIRAWNDYEGCLVVHLDSTIWRDACGVRWMLWAESAWFSFLKCAGSPFINQ